MSALLIATGNPGKWREFQALLQPEIEVSHPASGAPEVDENGTTYFENSLKKAVAYQAAFGGPVLADDSGLEVDCLGAEPGVFSARFGNVRLPWPERWAYLISRLEPFPQNDWTARFRCVLCFYDGKTEPRFFQGLAEGRIVSEPRGNQGFGYDPLFLSTVLGKTFAEASMEEKQLHSHRAAASRKFREWWLTSCAAAGNVPDTFVPR
jgi:XTP/dITP diphosphohydrolase